MCECVFQPVSVAVVGGVELPDHFLAEVEMNPSSGTG